MSAQSIFLPTVILVALTFMTAGWVLLLRIRAVRQGQLSTGYFRLNRGGKPPEQLTRVTQHYENLLELPPLFYLATIALYVLQQVDNVAIGLAWAYLLFRLLHTLVHTTYNNVLHRMVMFLGSCAVLIALWVRVGLQVIGT